MHFVCEVVHCFDVHEGEVVVMEVEEGGCVLELGFEVTVYVTSGSRNSNNLCIYGHAQACNDGCRRDKEGSKAVFLLERGNP